MVRIVDMGRAEVEMDEDEVGNVAKDAKVGPEGAVVRGGDEPDASLTPN